MTKGYLKHIQGISVDTLNDKGKRMYVSGAAWDKKSNIITVVNHMYAFAILENLSKEEQFEVWDSCNHLKEEFYDFSNILSVFDNDYHETYSDDRVIKYNISELQKEVSTIKKELRTRGKLYINHLGAALTLKKEFSICFNIELLLDIAKCLDKKEVTVYFPKKLAPIVIYGTFGRGMILPTNRR